MKNGRIVNAINAITPSEEVKDRVFKKAMQRQIEKPHVFSTAIPFATAAAVICLMVLGSMLFSPERDDMFTLKAYSMEQMDDGSIELREVDLLNETYYWNTYSDGSVFFVNANLQCEGENIKSVDFYADDCFFAKQYLTIENGKIVVEEGTMASYRKASDDGYVLVMYGDNFNVIGKHFTLENDAITDDFLLFLGKEVSDWREYPSQMTIRAVATFNDGKTQEQTITLDLANAEGVMGTGIIKLPPDELARFISDNVKRQELQFSIPLDQCEVIQGSVQYLTYGDTFEYDSPNDMISATHFFPITEDAITSAINEGLFDENGIFRQGSNLPDDGSDGYIAVIENNGDGMFTGMVYKVPGQLILEYMK